MIDSFVRPHSNEHKVVERNATATVASPSILEQRGLHLTRVSTAGTAYKPLMDPSSKATGFSKNLMNSQRRLQTDLPISAFEDVDRWSALKMASCSPATWGRGYSEVNGFRRRPLLNPDLCTNRTPSTPLSILSNFSHLETPCFMNGKMRHGASLSIQTIRSSSGELTFKNYECLKAGLENLGTLWQDFDLHVLKLLTLGRKNITEHC